MSLSVPSRSQSLSLSLSLSNLTPKLKISDIAIELRVACLSLLPHAPNLPHAAAPTTNRTAQRWKRVAGPTTNRTALRWRSNELVHVDAISVLSDGILTMEGENEWFLSMLESNGVVIVILTLLTLILLRFLFVIHRTGKRLRPTSAKPLSTLIVLGSGGHTAEMLNLLAALTI